MILPVVALFGVVLASPGDGRIATEFARLLRGENRSQAARALESVPRAELRAFLLGLEGEGLGDSARVEALGLMRAVGEGSDLALLARLARNGSDPVAPEVVEAFGTALASILERQPAACMAVEAILREPAGALEHQALVVLEGSRHPRATSALAKIASRGGTLAPTAFARLGRLASRDRRPAGTDVLDVVRRVLADPGSEAVQEAATCAGWLEDYGSAAALIERLEDPREGVRANAVWALRRISGLGFRGDVERWREWLAEEEAWWRDTWPRVSRELASGDRVHLQSALAAVAMRRGHRHEIAESVGRILATAEADVARMACKVLGLLRSGAAEGALRACLAHPDPGVREAAGRALEAIGMPAS